jgi:hypothetical protein
VAHRIGVVEDPSIPVGLLALIGAGALVAGNLAASLPARAAARVKPATVLRAG